MGLKDDIKVLIGELNRVHSGAISWHEDFELPNFVTAENGMQRHFTRKAQTALRQLSETLHANRLLDSPKIEIANYEKLVKQAVADMHADGEFSSFCETEDRACINKMRDIIEERLANAAQEYTHYFPAWTIGFENTAPFIIGPVSFLNKTDWLNSIDFSPKAKDTYLNDSEANHRWKEILKEAWQYPKEPASPEGLAGTIHGAVSKCPSLLKVTIRGYEREFSRKLAKLVCKTALDALSLGLGASEFFHQQALYEERLPPFRNNSLTESNGYLWLPGSSMSKRIPHLSGDRTSQALADIAIILPAFASILDGLVNPVDHKHPKLANRWATALDWFGEGNRESSDAIAVAKLGTSLDVLACGGKNAGISQMVTHLIETPGNTQVIKGPRPRTLSELVKDIYEDGRSKILHGTHFDRLESFAHERQHAAYLARVVLIESAFRLQHYSGNDEEKAFRTMPAVELER